MSTIFLSYARQDAELVQALATDLRALGNTVWLDEEVSGGQAWWHHILDQIRTCDVFVFALSSVTLESKACRRESDYATALGKPVLPIWLKGEESQNRLPPDLATLQYVDYREQTREASLRLARALMALPQAPPLPDPLPDPPDAPISHITHLAAQIRGDAPLNDETQNALVGELRRSLTDPETVEDARALLTRLRERRDLLARIAEDIDQALGTTPAIIVRPNRLRTILLSVAITVACLGLVAFFFRDRLVDETLKARTQDVQRLETQLTALQHERDEFKQRESELQKEIEKLAQERHQLTTDVDTAKQRVQTVEAELLKAEKALAQEKAARQAVRKDRDEPQERVSEFQTEVVASKPAATSESAASDLPILYINSIGIEFVLIQKGTFQIGSNNGDADEQPVHRVTLSQPFYLGRYEVTQAQWKEVMGGNPSEFTGDPKRPVTNVSWHDAKEFIRTLNVKERRDVYRLPTEAEWEYAARAGTTMAYSFGDTPGLLDQYGWYERNSGGTTRAVGQLKANRWGLYDMHGNVQEWVRDWYGKKYLSADHQTDPQGPENGSWRVIRGGSIFDSPQRLRSSRRVGFRPADRASYLGFRCVRVLSSP